MVLKTTSVILQIGTCLQDEYLSWVKLIHLDTLFDDNSPKYLILGAKLFSINNGSNITLTRPLLVLWSILPDKFESLPKVVTDKVVNLKTFPQIMPEAARLKALFAGISED